MEPVDTTKASSTTAYARIALRLRDTDLAERAAAEAFEAGATGLEEREDGALSIIYAPAAAAEAVREALLAVCGGAAALGPVEAVDATDWSEAWKAGLAATVVSPRLVIRPSFVEAVPGAGAELVIDPGQAFGTGGHASTRLALEWIDAIAPGLKSGARVLDVGTGTGVLALAALCLADVRAVGFDLDRDATSAARENAAVNGLVARLALFTGPLDALAPGAFELVVANLLRRELAPLAAGLAARLRPGGRLVVSGLLASEGTEVRGLLAAVGLREAAPPRSMESSGERWLSLLMRR